MEQILYLQINFFSIVVCMILLIHHKKKGIEVAGNYVFDVILFSACGVLVLDSISWVINGRIFPGCYILHMVVLSIDFVVQIIPCAYVFLYSLSEGQVKKVRKNILFYSPILLGVVMVFINLIHPYIFQLNRQNVYVRLPMFFIMGAIPVVYLVAAIVKTVLHIIKKKGMNCEVQKYLLVSEMLIALGVTAQLCVYGLETIWPMVSVAMLYLYINVQSRREEEMQDELKKRQVSIMLSQIQPHFLYNTLSTIRELCNKDSEKAERALDYFSSFLRVNMDSLVCHDLVHFSREWNHVTNYLQLEKLRFGDELQIETDIQEKNFYLPMLTIQPIVENAVKYGVGDSEDGGTIWIRTRRREDTIEIVIEDDGVGMEEAVQTGIEKQNAEKSHIGLANVKNRVKQMTGGDVMIESMRGKGTKVTILIETREENADEYTGGR